MFFDAFASLTEAFNDVVEEVILIDDMAVKAAARMSPAYERRKSPVPLMPS